jgi:2-haloacid dehalogenase
VTTLPAVRLLAFDVFGTVVDWRGSIAREIEALEPKVDGAAFADAWRGRYQPAMQQVRSGERPWANIDTLHRENLDAVLDQFGIADRFDEAARRDLNKAWHRLSPWPDSVIGLSRLKSRFVVTTLSNGNVALLTHMAKSAGLPWDCVISAETFRAYKPLPGAYLGLASLFDLQPHEVMLCAAHAADLRAAAACGLRTAYIDRPLEFGANQPGDIPAPGERFDLMTRSIIDLAAQLGC